LLGSDADVIDLDNSDSGGNIGDVGPGLPAIRGTKDPAVTAHIKRVAAELQGVNVGMDIIALIEVVSL
jgi:hypothetical protein